jgi:radical SAM superfamily enzyme YgiQ (UPF0313 family)
MRIALLSPKGPLYRHQGGIWRRSLRYSPLTLPTLASLVPPELGATVSIHDEGIADIPTDLQADLVGITAITGSAPRAYEIARRLRERGIPVVIGGSHATLVPDDAAPHADAVVTGYAEESWPELLRDFAAGRMKSRYEQAPGFRLGGYPRPRRDLLPRGRFRTTAVFEATRSCVHACEFCVAPTAWGRIQFQKPVEEVVEEIRAEGVRAAIFVDLNLYADPDYALRLWSALVPLGIHWYGLTTADLADHPEHLALAARSGCRGLLVGFESMLGSNLVSLRKGFHQPVRYRESVDRFHAAGIGLQGCFVFGLDGDDPTVFDATARFVVESGIDLPRFAIVTPFPGTALWQRLTAEGRILTHDWELYDAQHVVFSPSGMSADELLRGTGRAWRRVYEAGSIYRRWRKSALSSPVFFGTNFGYRFYARRLDRFYTCDWPQVRGSTAAPATEPT